MIPQKILIVEDEQDIRQLLNFNLTKNNYDVIEAKSGDEALVLLADQSFDLIILDIMMPGANGFEVMEAYKQMGGDSKIPVIFISALSSSDAITKGLENGAVDYITKPFSIKELLARIKLHLQLKAAYNEIRKSEEELRRTIAVKDKFFSIISHDLRGPTAALQGFAELLSANYDSLAEAKKKTCIKTMLDTSSHLSDLLENLLTWAQSQTNRLERHPRPINLNEISQRVVNLLKRNAENKGINLDLEINPQTEVFVDGNMLEVILRNLLANAIKYTDQGGRIRLFSQALTGYEQITVADSGVGMAQEDIAKLFRLDVHHSMPGTNKEKGTGLGLILCKEFVEKNNGSLFVQSQKGVGSQFTFTLPQTIIPATA
ncbi:MAG: hybrid sensor histidine kinase/response regulator [Desulfobulbaceae bacterium]|nr:hybrid sensor histidine kinase/response regulator [Desulfobulbaceae bacterium]HIJ79854.1 hybrid sensor histidine kinase/response regulator [Deltaproteobacteria bacterium]